MKPRILTLRRRRFIFIAALLCSLGIAVSLVLYALSQNINLFFTPRQLFSQMPPLGKRIRVGGMVKKGSFQRKQSTTEPLSLQFVITDFSHSLDVHYTGILPNLFKEGQGVVAQGYLGENNQFYADEILAKHDENYMPPELRSLIP